jgi:hypothetical protein
MKVIYPQGLSQRSDTHQSDRLIQAIEPLLTVRNDSVTWPQLIGEMLKVQGINPPESQGEVCRGGLATLAVGEALLGLINTFFIAGYRTAPDSTKNWVRVIQAENFLNQHAFAQFASAKLSLNGKGQANTAFYGFIGQENWAISRYACQLELDEKDMINGQSVNLYLRSVEELGRAANRVSVDLVYSLLLKNPNLSIDNQPLFSSAHNNVGSTALDESPLDVAMAAICSQTAPSNQSAPGGPTDVHINLLPKFLICAPALYGKARRCARNMALADGADLQVIPESRLGKQGLIDPLTEQPFYGSDNAWLLAGTSLAAPAVVVGALDGSLEPRTRVFDLAGPGAPGRWGIAIDCCLDCGAAALDYRNVYMGGVTQ